MTVVVLGLRCKHSEQIANSVSHFEWFTSEGICTYLVAPVFGFVVRLVVLVAFVAVLVDWLAFD